MASRNKLPGEEKWRASNVRRWLSLVGVVAVLSLVYVASANLLVNPSFEIGGTGGDNGGFGTAGGDVAAIGYWSYNSLTVEGYASHSGSNGVSFHNWWDGAYGGFGQDVVTNMNVGEVITFSTWGLFEPNYTSSTKETWMKVEFWQGGTLAAAPQYDVYDILAANRSTWNQLTFTVTNTLSGVTMIKPMIGYGNGTNLGLGPSAGLFDDLDLTITDAIPEPTIAGLLGFAGLLFCAVRRRSSK